MEEILIETKMLDLATQINYEPSDIEYLKKAMRRQIVHKPDDGANRKNYTNDGYATLGDALLKLILTEYFFDQEYDKGKITEKKKSIEKNKTLYKLCKQSGIFRYAYNASNFYSDAPLEKRVSHSEHDSYVEAVIAAIYKDKGFDYCKNWTILFLRKYNLLDC